MGMGARVFLCLSLLLAVAATISQAQMSNPHGAETDDNDFADFEEFDVEDEGTPKPAAEAPKQAAATPEEQEAPPREQQVKDKVSATDNADEDEATVEDEDDEFDNLDEEEFEGVPVAGRPKSQEKPPDFKINTVPVHLRTNWDSFYMEMLMLAGLGVYFLNFLAGKAKNHRLAQAWLNAHKELLDANFAIVGDDGTTKEVRKDILMKESENFYALWCTGRAYCEGMLVELKLLKRQDLISTISQIFKPASDQIMIRITMDETDMDSFIFAVGEKKAVGRLQKDMNDMSLFSLEKRSAEKHGLPPSYLIQSEMGEAASAMLDRTVTTVLNKFEGQIEYMHFSDQYSGPKLQDEGTPTKMPETKKVLTFCFNVPGKGKCNPRDMEGMLPLLKMVFYCMDKVKRFKLSRESKIKADKNRQKVEESFLKLSHAQRQEAAQARREDKRRAEKERMMQEEDPEKQRKWEERESRREAKKKQPKVKMLKMF